MITDFGITLVDGEPWHFIAVTYDVANYIRDQDQSMWYEHKDSSHFIFDITEELLIMLRLKFSQLTITI